MKRLFFLSSIILFLFLSIVPAYAIKVNAQVFLNETGVKIITNNVELEITQGETFNAKVIDSQRLAQLGATEFQNGELIQVKYLGQNKLEISNKLKSTHIDWVTKC